MSEHTLPRTGTVPLSFDGEAIAVATSWDNDGPGEARWHELELYRTVGGSYVLAITYKSAHRGEGPRHEVNVCKSAADVRDYLAGYEPAPRGIGYPPGPEYLAKQARMIDNLRFRFESAVSDLFGSLGDEVADRID